VNTISNEVVEKFLDTGHFMYPHVLNYCSLAHFQRSSIHGPQRLPLPLTRRISDHFPLYYSISALNNQLLSQSLWSASRLRQSCVSVCSKYLHHSSPSRAIVLSAARRITSLLRSQLKPMQQRFGWLINLH